jgi:synaptojanin
MWRSNGHQIKKIKESNLVKKSRQKKRQKDFQKMSTINPNNTTLSSSELLKQLSIETFISNDESQLIDDQTLNTLTSKRLLRLPQTVQNEIIKQYKKYTQPKKCLVSVHTWNIGGGINHKTMKYLDLKDWLINGPRNVKQTVSGGYLNTNFDFDQHKQIDIFVVGFQEIVDLNVTNMLNTSKKNSVAWRNKIYDFLSNYGDYVPIIFEPLQLVGVCLFIFVLKKHSGSIRDVCVEKNKTGLRGSAGNKGAVLIRFVFYNTSMCFICSHFAAHQKEIKQRNEDFAAIYSTQFSGPQVSSLSPSNKIETIFHDYVFWCGDLNYVTTSFCVHFDNILKFD